VQRCREGGGAVMFDVCSSCAVLHAEVLSGWRGSEGAEVQTRYRGDAGAVHVQRCRGLHKVQKFRGARVRSLEMQRCLGTGV